MPAELHTQRCGKGHAQDGRRDDAAPQPFHADDRLLVLGCREYHQRRQASEHAVEPMGKASGQPVEKPQRVRDL